MEIPCNNCSYYNSLSNNSITCLCSNVLDFYGYSDIDKMINKCPKGYRARKRGNSIQVWREYDKVEKY